MALPPGAMQPTVTRPKVEGDRERTSLEVFPQVHFHLNQSDEDAQHATDEKVF